MQPGHAGSNAVPQLPELVNNPLASLWHTDTYMRVAGRDVMIPAQPAAVWLELLMGDLEQLDLDTVFPGLADDEGQDWVEEVLFTEQVSISDIQMMALDLISFVSGRPWWVALRMLHIAQQKWSILGSTLAIKGVDPGRLSLSAWLDALWLVMFDHLPHDKWTLVASQIEAPPPGFGPENPMDALEMDTNQFTSLMRG